MGTKTPFSKSLSMKPEYELLNTLALRRLFREHETICIAGDPQRHSSTWFIIDKERFFNWTERRADLYNYTYVVEIALTDIGSCVRIHAVERTRKP